MKSSGYCLVELMCAVGVAATLAAVGTPQLLVTVDDSKTLGAVRYLATRLQQARMEAVTRGSNVAIRVTHVGEVYSYTAYQDGNRNGVLSEDISAGIDPAIHPSERLPDQFSGVDFGVLPGLPAVDSGTSPPGTDPIHLGSGNMASFSAAGTSSSGSVYVRGRRNTQYVIRIFGETGKTRILKYSPQTSTWRAP